MKKILLTPERLDSLISKGIYCEGSNPLKPMRVGNTYIVTDGQREVKAYCSQNCPYALAVVK